MSSVKTPSTPRELAVAEAAVSVLAGDGPRGLTHRAVDRVAGLPQGSTSNLYRTRAALLSAVNAYIAGTDAAELLAAGVVLRDHASRHDLAQGLAEIINTWTCDVDVRTAARFEMFLEARRSPALASDVAQAREAFRALTRETLSRLGCRTAERHAAPFMALVDGLVVNQLLHPVTRLSASEIADSIARWLETC